MDDQKLIEQVQKGDEMAFEEIVARYKNRIVNFVYQMVGDYEKAVDLAQETFMRVYFKAGHYKPIAPLSSWIYTIASNLAKTDLKKNRRYSHTPIEDVQNLASSGLAVQDDPENSTMVNRVKQVLSTLHPRYRIPVILKDVEGFTQEEIAQIMKKPVGTIKARISRGRSYLKNELEKGTVQIKFTAENRELENGRA